MHRVDISPSEDLTGDEERLILTMCRKAKGGKGRSVVTVAFSESEVKVSYQEERDFARVVTRRA